MRQKKKFKYYKPTKDEQQSTINIDYARGIVSFETTRIGEYNQLITRLDKTETPYKITGDTEDPYFFSVEVPLDRTRHLYSLIKGRRNNDCDDSD